MPGKNGWLLLCAAAVAAPVYAETFVIQVEDAGHEAMVTMPAGALNKVLADRVETLRGADGDLTRLSGNVLIDVNGANGPFRIKAESVVLELTGPAASGRGAPKILPAGATLQSTAKQITIDSDIQDTQTLVGDVVLKGLTIAGPFRITADRVVHNLGPEL